MTEEVTARSIEVLVPPSESAEPEEPRYRGVAGWLLFFCISLTILNPLATIFRLVISFHGDTAVFGRYPGLLLLTVADYVMTVVVMGLSIRAGISLWRVAPGAVRIATTYLYIGAAYTVVEPFTPLLAGLPSAVNGEIVTSAITSVSRGILYYLIWLNYLRRSKRVKATYSSESGPA